MLQQPEPLAQAAKPVFYIWPECVPVWGLWLAVQTQWRYAGMSGHPSGLDYAGVGAYLQAQGYGHSKRRSIGGAFEDLRAMESATLRAWDEQRALNPNG